MPGIRVGVKMFGWLEFRLWRECVVCVGLAEFRGAAWVRYRVRSRNHRGRLPRVGVRLFRLWICGGVGRQFRRRMRSGPWNGDGDAGWFLRNRNCLLAYSTLRAEFGGTERGQCPWIGRCELRPGRRRICRRLQMTEENGPWDTGDGNQLGDRRRDAEMEFRGGAALQGRPQPHVVRGRHRGEFPGSLRRA
jgi:hypothetical protein